MCKWMCGRACMYACMWLMHVWLCMSPGITDSGNVYIDLIYMSSQHNGIRHPQKKKLNPGKDSTKKKIILFLQVLLVFRENYSSSNHPSSSWLTPFTRDTRLGVLHEALSFSTVCSGILGFCWSRRAYRFDRLSVNPGQPSVLEH